MTFSCLRAAISFAISFLWHLACLSLAGTRLRHRALPSACPLLIASRGLDRDCRELSGRICPGMSPPPIETPRGWLMIYRGVRRTPSSSVYRLGLALFDLEQPVSIPAHLRRPSRSDRSWSFVTGFLSKARRSGRSEAGSIGVRSFPSQGQRWPTTSRLTADSTYASS